MHRMLLKEFDRNVAGGSVGEPLEFVGQLWSYHVVYRDFDNDAVLVPKRGVVEWLQSEQLQPRFHLALEPFIRRDLVGGVV